MKQLVGVVFLLLLAVTAFAHEGEARLVSAGVTEDSILWGLDRALENIKLLLTFNREERIRIGLAIAQERLAEARELQEEGKSSHATLEEYAVALNRVRRQLEKYGADAPEAKEFVLDVQDDLDIQEHALESFEQQESVSEAKRKLKEAIDKHKSSLGIEAPPVKEKIEELILHAAEPLEVSPEQTEDAEEDAAPSEIEPSPVTPKFELSIRAEEEGNITRVSVTGDTNITFNISAKGLVNVTRAIADELGIPESEVASTLVLRDGNALKIIVTVEGDDLSRIVIRQNGEEKKFALSIIDHAAIIKELSKRTGLEIPAVESVTTFIDLYNP